MFLISPSTKSFCDIAKKLKTAAMIHRTEDSGDLRAQNNPSVSKQIVIGNNSRMSEELMKCEVKLQTTRKA